MITPKEIKRILSKDSKQSSKNYGFDSAIKGLGIISNKKDVKKVSSKHY